MKSFAHRLMSHSMGIVKRSASVISRIENSFLVFFWVLTQEGLANVLELQIASSGDHCAFSWQSTGHNGASPM